MPKLSHVSLTIQKFLSVHEAYRPGWEAELEELVAAGNNFFLIVPRDSPALDQAARILELSADDLPKACDRRKLFSMISFIDPADFDRMLAAQEKGSLTCFIEQMDLPRTRPPRVKPFLVYCSVRGIVSQHESQREARESCSAYSDAMSGLKNSHEATVYRWRGNDWHNTETC